MVRSKHQLFTLLGTGALLTLFVSPFKTLGTSLSPELASTTTTLIPQINLVQAVVLGMVQGLTEFLPISSTGHLKVMSVALGWGDPSIAFTAILELGSIAAVIWYLWRHLVQIVVGAMKAILTSDYPSHDLWMVVGIGLGTLPIVCFGLVLKLFIPDFDHSPLRHLSAIAITSIVMAILLGFAERFGQRRRNFKDLSVGDGVLMGLAQAMAVIPGVSRSGSTLTAGLLMGLERATAARFSFLLAIPAIILADLVGIKRCFQPRVRGCPDGAAYGWVCFILGVLLFGDRRATTLPANPKHLDICLVSVSLWNRNSRRDRDRAFKECLRAIRG